MNRNADRFLEGFAFRPSSHEATELVTIWDWFNRIKHSTVTPMAFTEDVVVTSNFDISNQTFGERTWKDYIYLNLLNF